MWKETDNREIEYKLKRKQFYVACKIKFERFSVIKINRMSFRRRKKKVNNA